MAPNKEPDDDLFSLASDEISTDGENPTETVVESLVVAEDSVTTSATPRIVMRRDFGPEALARLDRIIAGIEAVYSRPDTTSSRALTRRGNEIMTLLYDTETEEEFQYISEMLDKREGVTTGKQCEADVEPPPEPAPPPGGQTDGLAEGAAVGHWRILLFIHRMGKLWAN